MGHPKYTYHDKVGETCHPSSGHVSDPAILNGCRQLYTFWGNTVTKKLRVRQASVKKREDHWSSPAPHWTRAMAVNGSVVTVDLPGRAAQSGKNLWGIVPLCRSSVTGAGRSWWTVSGGNVAGNCEE